MTRRECVRYAEAVEGLGFAHLLTYDHVVGADPAGHPGFSGPYDIDSLFHEPLVLYGYLAAVAPRLELVTGILILPQRQTVLVAKQAAEVDILTGGRFRLGIGQGWNAVEYEALGVEFADRGRRMEEQIELLRRLWQEPRVSFEGRYHTVTAAGLNPLPVQQPIPIWMGGFSAAALQRIARLGDGFFPGSKPPSTAAGGRRSSRCASGGGTRAATPTTSASKPVSTWAPARPTTGTGRRRSGERSEQRTSRSTRCEPASTEPTPQSGVSTEAKDALELGARLGERARDAPVGDEPADRDSDHEPDRDPRHDEGEAERDHVCEQRELSLAIAADRLGKLGLGLVQGEQRERQQGVRDRASEQHDRVGRDRGRPRHRLLRATRWRPG